jgi:hypothetical protein
MYILYMNRDDYVMMSVEELNTELTKLRNSSPKLVHLIKKLIEYKDSTQVLSEEPAKTSEFVKNTTRSLPRYWSVSFAYKTAEFI